METHARVTLNLLLFAETDSSGVKRLSRGSVLAFMQAKHEDEVQLREQELQLRREELAVERKKVEGQEQERLALIELLT